MGELINIIFNVVEALLIIRIVLSWVMPHGRSRNQFVSFIYEVTEPILSPFRFLIPVGNMGIDLSPIVVFFILRLLRGLVLSIF